MKKVCLLIILVLSGFQLMAQTGLFELSFQESYASVQNKLILQGFKQLSADDISISYTCPAIPELAALTIYVNPEDQLLVGWIAVYLAEHDPDRVFAMIDHLMDIHGEEPLYDEDTEEFTWLFDDDRSLSLSYEASDDIMTVFYYDFAYEDLFY